MKLDDVLAGLRKLHNDTSIPSQLVQIGEEEKDLSPENDPSEREDQTTQNTS